MKCVCGRDLSCWWGSGGSPPENFEISRPENAISCNLRMWSLRVYPRKFWNFKARKCNFLQSEDDRSGGSPLENFEISRPENAFSCNLRMGGLRVYPRKFWNFKTWKCNFLQSEVMEVWRPPPENFEISRLENVISCNLRMDFQSAWSKILKIKEIRVENYENKGNKGDSRGKLWK